MKNAQIISRPAVVQAQPKIVDPLNKTVHMAIRKERRRKDALLAEITAEMRAKEEARVLSGKFNSIKGFNKLKVG